MSLLDVFTGGKAGSAEDALKRAEQYFANVQTPTVQQLTLPQLQQYVEAGVITPEQAQAYLQQTNAYNDQNIDQTGTANQIQALNQLANIAQSGAEGTPTEQAAIENALQQVRTSDQGSLGAIEQGMAARGTPYALIQGALESQAHGQNAQQAHLDAVNAQAAAYQNALNALSGQGSLASSLQGQQNAQANQVAAAQNAMQQFNAANQQQNSQFNAANRQEANTMNAANKQQVSNNNVGNANARTQYNAQLPQQVFSNNLAKAQGMAGAATNIGDLEQQQGKQNAGIFSGLINTATSFIPRPQVAQANDKMPAQYAHGGMVGCGHAMCHGGVCMAEGGQVPGESLFSGDSPMNDTVPAQLSPGEAVIPRTTVAEHPDLVSSLLGDSQQQDPSGIDFQDVATLLKALRSIRMGVV